MNAQAKHEVIVKKVVLKLLRQKAETIEVNLSKNPGLASWVKKNPRLKPME